MEHKDGIIPLVIYWAGFAWLIYLLGSLVVYSLTHPELTQAQVLLSRWNVVLELIIAAVVVSLAGEGMK